MPRLRLFATAAEAAGCSVDEVPTGTVATVLAEASARYGPSFTAVAKTCQIWVNGEAVPMDFAVQETDEIAILPPVSGG